MRNKMNERGSNTDLAVTEWIQDLNHGRSGAESKLYRHFYPRLVRFAVRMIGNSPRRWWDEEDVVSKAFASFFRRSKNGDFNAILNRNELWRLLATITKRKAINHIRDQQTVRRGGASLPMADAELSDQNLSLADVCKDSLSPVAIVEIAEAKARALAVLDPELAEVASCRFDGYTNVEIAARINRSVPTVERRLRLIRQKLLHEGLA
ncbi:MAG TPA: sigma-70 family RNA polymerase sigma factor [Planctomycetaceae bacterium]|nr:sigma-70 family RNA polymerase sigma factor [Planctomycetaceae bacterium]